MKKIKLVDIVNSNGLRTGFCINSNNLYKVEKVPVERLVIDGDIQRAWILGHVKNIIKAFAPEKVKIPCAFSDDEGNYWIYDGQHTSLALIALGAKEIEIAVTPFNTTDPEIRTSKMSDAFVSINTSGRKMDLYTLFKNKVQTGNKAANAILKICNSYGCQPAPKAKNPGDITHIKFLESVYSQIPNTLGDTLDIMTNVWPGDVIKGPVMLGIARMLLTIKKPDSRPVSAPFNLQLFKQFCNDMELDSSEKFHNYMMNDIFKKDRIHSFIQEISQQKAACIVTGYNDYIINSGLDTSLRMFVPGVIYK